MVFRLLQAPFRLWLQEAAKQPHTHTQTDSNPFTVGACVSVCVCVSRVALIILWPCGNLQEMSEKRTASGRLLSRYVFHRKNISHFPFHIFMAFSSGWQQCNNNNYNNNNAIDEAEEAKSQEETVNLAHGCKAIKQCNETVNTHPHTHTHTHIYIHTE